MGSFEHRKVVEAFRNILRLSPPRQHEVQPGTQRSDASRQSVRGPARTARLLLFCGLVALMAVGLLKLPLGGVFGDPASFAPSIPTVGSIIESATRTQPNESPASTTPKKPNYLSTAGSKIVDAEGHEVRLTGVNWFGMETQTFSPQP